MIAALLGRKSVMACTAAVETVVIAHLESQITELNKLGDLEAVEAVRAIYDDEKEHQKQGTSERADCIFYNPCVAVVKGCTEAVIWLGMRL